uniref:Golgi SNAP receptor complex member 1 n=2 Tax=Araucaria cunninghamii TaxID=56994 RepID=A0A0D6R5T6_ARACU
MDLPGTWDDLRKQARKLEGQLDEKLASYRKLINAKHEGYEQEHEAGIERLLQQLQQVNAQMQVWVSSGTSDVLSHTLTRHKEILHDLNQEFIRLRSSFKARREHEALLQSFSARDSVNGDLEKNSDSAEQALLNEQAILQRSTGQMDNVVLHAQATLGALVFQRSTFGNISSKLTNVSSRLPSVNHVLSAIRRRKSMDTIILSLVASACTIFILLYWLSK